MVYSHADVIKSDHAYLAILQMKVDDPRVQDVAVSVIIRLDAFYDSAARSVPTVANLHGYAVVTKFRNLKEVTDGQLVKLAATVGVDFPAKSCESAGVVSERRPLLHRDMPDSHIILFLGQIYHRHHRVLLLNLVDC